tara:strand:+ start:220 stop:513 length:294 start_codon:yes stop_codon:yes gene_type:complete
VRKELSLDCLINCQLLILQMIDSNKLVKGQKLAIELDKVRDRLPNHLLKIISDKPLGTWMGGYKMVDGNQFGIVLELSEGTSMWFFESELSYCDISN